MNQQGFGHTCGSTCLASQMWCPFCPQHIIQYAAEQRSKVSEACPGQGDPNPSGSGSDLRRDHRVTRKKGEAESHRGNAGVKTRPAVFIKGRREEVRVGPCALLSWSDYGLDLLGRSAEGVILSMPFLMDRGAWWQAPLDSRPVGATGWYVWDGQRLVMNFTTAPQFLLHLSTLCSDGAEGWGGAASAAEGKKWV